MNTLSWVIVIILGIAFLFGLMPIAMHAWGAMFAKGFFSDMRKYFKQKTDKNEDKKEE